MATEKEIKRVLDLLTTASKSKVESLRVDSRSHTESLRKKVEQTNIIGLGIANKITKGEPMGKLALTFYVLKKISLKKLMGDQVIPPTVPESLSGSTAIPTDVVVLGKMVPEINAIRNPIQPGNSIGHVAITAGTLGAVVTDNTNRLFLLSNSHVLANSGIGKKGDNIVYPGKFDGGKDPADVIAKLHKFKPFIGGGNFINHTDCAIARPVAGRLANLVAEFKGVGLPKGTIAPKRGMKVVKVGRTTGKTTGEIRDVNFRFTLDYGEPGLRDVGFIEQVLCTRYTAGGDSGSLVLDTKTGKAVGLHFAGANGGSVFNPIDKVLSALSVRLVTRSIAEKVGGRSRPVKKIEKAAKKTARRKIR